jgi:hypothetical protein
MAAWAGELPDLDIIRRIIALARANHVRLTLVITPHHGDTLEIYWRLGLWPRVEQLKAELAAMMAPQDDAVTLWDFMDYSAFSTETIPAAGDRGTPTHWFWEPTHFKKQLGAIMVQRMFGQGAPEFGARLTPGNVAERNAQVRSQRQARVCGQGEVPLLTSLTTPLPDGCPATVSPRGPT